MNQHVRTTIVACFALLLLVNCTSAYASLLGDQVGGYMLYKHDPNMGNLFEPGVKPGCPECMVPDPFESSSIQPVAVVLDPDIIFREFIFRHIGLHDVTVDIDKTVINLSLLNTSGSAATENPYGFEIYLSSLNPKDGEVPGIITSASIVDESLFPGLSVSVVDGGTGLLLDFSDAAPGILDAYNNFGILAATITLETMWIPEPGTCALAGLGLIGILGGMRRERR